MEKVTMALIGLVVLLVCGFSVHFTIFHIMKRPETNVQPPVFITSPPQVPLDTATKPAVTESPSKTAMPSQVAAAVGSVSLLGPFPPLVPVPRFEIVPGAAWPVLVGRPRDQVVGWLMTTYPTLVVRAVPASSYTPVVYAPRDDRITIVYDPMTKEVRSARIG